MMRGIIRDVVGISLPRDVFDIDWTGPEGREIADDAVATSYRLLNELDF